MGSTAHSQPDRLPILLSWLEIDYVLAVPEAVDDRPVRTCCHCGWHGVIVNTIIGQNRDGSPRYRCFHEEACVDRWSTPLNGRPMYGVLIVPNGQLPLPLTDTGAA